MKKALAWAKRNWLNLWLLSQTAVALALFFYGAGSLQANRIAPRIARINSGVGSRRERGVPSFRAAARGAGVMDWEGAASPVTSRVNVRIEGFREYTLEPDTVVVFRSPFGPDPKAESRFRVLKGSVTLDNVLVKAAGRESQSSEVPKAEARPAGSISAKTYPRMNSRILVARPGQAALAFFWGEKADGFLVVLAEETQQVSYFPLSTADHAHATVPIGHSYLWQVINPDRKVLFGPFRFELAAGGRDAWNKLLSDPSSHRQKGGVDILLDDDRVR